MTQLSLLPYPRNVAYHRVWCLGHCGYYARRRSEPRVCPRCGAAVITVPVLRKGAP